MRVAERGAFGAGYLSHVWESMERAEGLTNCGLFLFMADDKLAVGSKPEFAPRDNVVYEAGYSAGAKGQKKSLVVREKGAKLPTDLEGRSYTSTLPTETTSHRSKLRYVNI